jgi:hypothetical protein
MKYQNQAGPEKLRLMSLRKNSLRWRCPLHREIKVLPAQKEISQINDFFDSIDPTRTLAVTVDSVRAAPLVLAALGSRLSVAVAKADAIPMDNISSCMGNI